MSNLPDNTPGPRRFTSTVHCTRDLCGYAWAAEFITDLGMTHFVNDYQAYCPQCGAEGE